MCSLEIKLQAYKDVFECERLNYILTCAHAPQCQKDALFAVW